MPRLTPAPMHAHSNADSKEHAFNNGPNQGVHRSYDSYRPDFFDRFGRMPSQYAQDGHSNPSRHDNDYDSSANVGGDRSLLERTRSEDRNSMNSESEQPARNHHQDGVDRHDRHGRVGRHDRGEHQDRFDPQDRLDRYDHEGHQGRVDHQDHVSQQDRAGQQLGTSSDPPLPTGAPATEDDGWSAHVSDEYGTYYFVNNKTGVSTWTNPRVPEASSYPGYSYATGISALGAPPELGSSSYAMPSSTYGAPGTTSYYGVPGSSSSPPVSQPAAGGYNPKIHGSWDDNAPYAQRYRDAQSSEAAAEFDIESARATAVANGVPYAATGAFNRFTGKFQAKADIANNFTDEKKAGRQMMEHFDVIQAANMHDGRSLKAERAAQPLGKKRVAFYKRREANRKHKNTMNFLTKE